MNNRPNFGTNKAQKKLRIAALVRARKSQFFKNKNIYQKALGNSPIGIRTPTI